MTESAWRVQNSGAILVVVNRRAAVDVTGGKAAVSGLIEIIFGVNFTGHQILFVNDR
jgi:hypothetical protein